MRTCGIERPFRVLNPWPLSPPNPGVPARTGPSDVTSVVVLINGF